MHESRAHTTVSRHLRPLLKVNQDASKFLIGSHGPLGRLPHLLNPLFLEHLDKVLLDARLNDLSVLFGSAVHDLTLLQDERILDLISRKELLPLFRACKVEVHHDRIVDLLNVAPDVLAAHNAVDLSHWADRVLPSHLHVRLRLELDAEELALLVFFVLEEVALASQWVPQFKAAVFDRLLAHDVDEFARRHTITEDYERLVARFLHLIYVGEVVGQEYSVLFVVTAAQIEELL